MMLSPASQSGIRSGRAAGGFSLIEVMIVMAIAVFLVTLVAVVWGKMKATTKASSTQLTLQGALGVASVYNGETSVDINHQSDVSTPVDWSTAKAFDDNTTGSAVITGSGATAAMRFANLSSERFVWAAYQYSKTRAMVMALKAQNALVDLDGDHFLEIVDAWNQPVAYAAKVSHSDTYGDDDFLPTNPKHFFASAGADGDFGDAEANAEPTGVRKDNIYSFDMNRTPSR